MSDKPTNALILRTFCAASECPIWEALERTDDDVVKTPLRQQCRTNCKGYEFQKWLDLTGRRIE